LTNEYEHKRTKWRLEKEHYIEKINLDSKDKECMMEMIANLKENIYKKDKAIREVLIKGIPNHHSIE
jgi:hypothetical protein